jgi:hypothetical protein
MASDNDRNTPRSDELSTAQGRGSTFSADQVADAFDVDIERVRRAIQGEFQLTADASVDSRQAQHLAEVILGDLPLEQREAALMKLGAFTPRADMVDASVAEKAAGEQSDRIRPSEEVPEIGAPRESGD